MCGDLDEEDRLETALCARFRGRALTLLKRHETGAPAAAADINSYLDKLFADALRRCLRDIDESEESRRYTVLAAQPLVFARLAGFLAAHASLQDDPLRKVLEALTHGYAEADQIEPDHDHAHHMHGADDRTPRRSASAHSRGHDHHH